MVPMSFTFRTVDLLGIDNTVRDSKRSHGTFRTVDLLCVDNSNLVG